MNRCPRCGHPHDNDIPTCKSCIDKLEKELPSLIKQDQLMLKKEERKRRNQEFLSDREYRKHVISVGVIS